jgi:hypothetical protein
MWLSLSDDGDSGALLLMFAIVVTMNRRLSRISLGHFTCGSLCLCKRAHVRVAVAERANPIVHHVAAIAWHQILDSIWNFPLRTKVQPLALDVMAQAANCAAGIA